MIRPDFLSDPALSSLWDALPDARIVGGAVRDALAGRPVADFDLATPQSPDAVIAALKQAGLKVVPTGLAHGTVTAVLDGRGFEITTLRQDVETDGRHAIVAFTADWKQDASRRDFTINAMSMTRDGRVHDYFGGVADLAAGRVRFVGEPATRIAEDYLRILRFFRFHARFGRVPPDPETLTALKAGIPGLARLSVERVWSELRRILGAPDPDEAIGLMFDLGIWAAAVPEAMTRAPLADLPPDPVLRLAAMLTGDPLTLATRLKFSNDDRVGRRPPPASGGSPAGRFDRPDLVGPSPRRTGQADRHEAASFPASRAGYRGSRDTGRPRRRDAAARYSPVVDGRWLPGGSFRVHGGTCTTGRSDQNK